MSETRKANIRFDMDNEMHRKAWQLLQDRDKNRYSSYSQTIVQALIKLLSEDASEFAEKSESSISLSDISETVEHAAEKAIERSLPSFLAGYMACAAGLSSEGFVGKQIPANTTSAEEDDIDSSADIDFDFLGLN